MSDKRYRITLEGVGPNEALHGFYLGVAVLWRLVATKAKTAFSMLDADGDPVYRSEDWPE